MMLCVQEVGQMSSAPLLSRMSERTNVSPHPLVEI
jgi:hypothetical protein